MTNNIVWAALVTRIPATDDLPMSTLVDLIETSNNDVENRTGHEITKALSPSERARCRTALALGHTQPCLKNADGHNASQAWAWSRTASAERVFGSMPAMFLLRLPLILSPICVISWGCLLFRMVRRQGRHLSMFGTWGSYE